MTLTSLNPLPFSIGFLVRLLGRRLHTKGRADLHGQMMRMGVTSEHLLRDVGLERHRFPPSVSSQDAATGLQIETLRARGI